MRNKNMLKYILFFTLMIVLTVSIIQYQNIRQLQSIIGDNYYKDIRLMEQTVENIIYDLEDKGINRIKIEKYMGKTSDCFYLARKLNLIEIEESFYKTNYLLSEINSLEKREENQDELKKTLIHLDKLLSEVIDKNEDIYDWYEDFRQQGNN